MKGNIYTDKYKNETEGGGNRAVSSIAACERAISKIAKAKDYLAKGDKKNWFLELGKLPDETGELQKLVKNPELGQWGHDMQIYYLQLSLMNSKVILDDPKDPTVADEILGLFQNTRDYWNDILVQAAKASAGESSESEIGGLI